jgi:DNA repair protein RecN (Recombination protein N)
VVFFSHSSQKNLHCSRGRVLLELRIENYAIIEHALVEFSGGLNLLTGETGAGKSILIDALSLLLGGRASGEVVRHGAEKTTLAAVFTSTHGGIEQVLESAGIDAESNELILRREIVSNGKGRAFVNNQPATVAVLREIAPYLGVIHAQNESLVAFDGGEKRALLDRFAGIDLADLTAAFEKQKQIRQRLADLERGEQDKLRLLDLWSFQKKEIEGARLEPAEDTKLEGEKRILANAEKLHAAAMSAHELLYDSETSAVSSLAAAERQIEELAHYDERFREAAGMLSSARIAAEDVGVMVRDYAQGIDASPDRLAQIEDRLALLDRLKRKYGATIDEVIAFGEDVACKLNEIENRDQVLADLRQQLDQSSVEYLRAAGEVSQRRQVAAKRMEKTVEAEVNELAMKARFQVRVTSSDAPEHWSASGIDTVEFLIATNAGEPLHPLEQIASGGELSRVMLALKLVTESGLGKTDGRSRALANVVPRMLIFDEIDTGIGGRAAEAVGRKLKALAGTHQVLCITHLPQIASFADQHLLIEKLQRAGRTKTLIRKLDAGERKQELARMMSGAEVTASSRQHAEQLLKANA